MSASEQSPAAPPLAFVSAGMLREQARHLRGGMIAGADMATIARQLDAAALQLELAEDAKAIRRFANLMTVKMARKTHEGLHEWPTVPPAHLWAMLRESVDKGDPVDVANFAMMIHHDNETTREGDGA